MKQGQAAEAAKTSGHRLHIILCSGHLLHIILDSVHCGGVGAQRFEIAVLLPIIIPAAIRISIIRRAHRPRACQNPI